MPQLKSILCLFLVLILFACNNDEGNKKHKAYCDCIGKDYSDLYSLLRIQKSHFFHLEGDSLDRMNLRMLQAYKSGLRNELSSKFERGNDDVCELISDSIFLSWVDKVYSPNISLSHDRLDEIVLDTFMANDIRGVYHECIKEVYGGDEFADIYLDMFEHDNSGNDFILGILKNKYKEDIIRPNKGSLIDIILINEVFLRVFISEFGKRCDFNVMDYFMAKPSAPDAYELFSRWLKQDSEPSVSE
ncbi:MAG: hypothetical protein ACI94Y_001755 [Maribacter sp.]|jgi:hypothetical protein